MLGISTTNVRVGGFRGKGVDANAQTIYNRIIADGGVSNLTRLNFFVKGLKAIYGDLANVPVCYDAHWIGYKLGSGTGATAGQAVAKLYTISVIQSVTDSDAQAFIYRVYNAGGELTDTEANAVDKLVKDMKAANVWDSMKAVYPMVGASAAACAQNLKSSSFTGTFNGGWTFASTGVTPNGTNAFMNTGLNPVAQGLTSGDSHLGYYARTAATTTDAAEMGNYTDPNLAFVLQSKSGSNVNRFFYTLTSAAFSPVVSGVVGFMFGSSTGGNTRRDIYKNGISLANNTTTDTATLGNYNIYIGAANMAGKVPSLRIIISLARPSTEKIW